MIKIDGSNRNDELEVKIIDDSQWVRNICESNSQIKIKKSLQQELENEKQSQTKQINDNRLGNKLQ